MSIETIERHGKTVSHRAVVRIGQQKISKTFKRKLEAQLWEAEKRVWARTPDALLPPPSEPVTTLDELMARFEKEYSQIKNAPSTRIMNRSLYDNYLKKPFGAFPLNKINRHLIDQYLRHLKNDGAVSNGRIHRVRQFLHILFNQAARWDLVSSNPITHVMKFPIAESLSPSNLQYLSKEEADTLQAWTQANDPWLFPKIVTLLHTGIRYGEMVALRVEDARLSAASPHLSIGRSRCRHTGELVPPKGKRTRMIPLSPGLVGFLRPFIQKKRHDEPLLWRDWRESRWPTKFENHFLKALRKAKVSRVKIHDLRHTFAVRFLENGGHIYDLKELLGHRDVKLTMRYSHFSAAMADRARGIVDFHPSTPQLTVVDGGVR